MSEHALAWDARALWEQLDPLLPGLNVEVLHHATSTNTELLERARALHCARTGDADARVQRSVESGAFGRRAIDLQPCLLVAEHQSGGRGRQGREWQSVAGASLTFSIGVPLAADNWSGLSLAVGAALADALDPPPHAPAGPRIGVKWPNDLWLVDSVGGAPLAGRKLGGILIETVAAAAQRLVVVGVGLNVLPFEAAELNTGFASLRELDPGATAPSVLARVAAPLVRALQRFERDGFAAFAERYAARDILCGQSVRTTLAELPEGIAQGVSAQGELLLRTPRGVERVVSGEVSVRPAGGR